MEVVIKIEVKDNNVEQALRVLKEKTSERWFFLKLLNLKIIMKSHQKKKKRILQENIKRVKKLNKLKNRI